MVWLVVSIFSAAGLAGCVGPGGEEDEGIDTGPPADSDPGSQEQETDTGFETADGVVFPGAVWPTADPAEKGMDGEILESAAALADENDSHCFVVTRGGVLVGEWYYGGWNADTTSNVFSITKSVTSLVVGAAVHEGLLDIEQPASAFIPSWEETESDAVSVRHLLSMTSGRSWDLLSDLLTLAFSTDATGYAVGLGQDHEPGEHWEYNNTAVQALEAVLDEALGGGVAEWAEAHLFGPIGADATYSMDDSDNPLLYSELRASCRDLARFGYLVLRDGMWGEERLIDAAYIDAALEPSSAFNSAYGYLFWLNREGHWKKPAVSPGTPAEEGDGRLWPDAPEHIAMAKGLQGQLIVIDPETGLVFTRIGGDPSAASAVLSGADLQKEAFIAELLDQVLSAVQEK